MRVRFHAFAPSSNINKKKGFFRFGLRQILKFHSVESGIDTCSQVMIPRSQVQATFIDIA